MHVVVAEPQYISDYVLDKLLSLGSVELLPSPPELSSDFPDCGSAFSLIPAQNASGNWIKVVQRLPVRIRLDPRDLAAHPLRIGLSMKAAIDVAGAR